MKYSDESPECDDKFKEDDNMDEDNELERSYNGSNTDYYYELKEERKEKK